MGAAAALLLVAAGLAAFGDDQEAGRDVVAGPGDPDGTSDRRGVFTEPTGTVLVLSDGIDGVLAIDLDRRIVGRRAIDGERAGDQDFRLTLTQGHLVVGWGEIWAAPLSGGQASLVGEATTYIPASEPGQVWLLDYAGGRIGQGAAKLQRVTLDGDVLVETVDYDPGRYPPVIGVPGGLAVRTPEGMAVVDPVTGEVGPLLGPIDDQGIPGAVTNGEQLIWCVDDGCQQLATAALPQAGDPTPPHRSSYAAPVLAPDGNRVAVSGRAGTPQHSLRLFDAASGTLIASTPVPAEVPPDAEIIWSPDGAQVFFVGYSYGDASGETLVARYEPSEDQWETVAIPAVGAVGGIAIRADQADYFLPDQLADPSTCGAVMSYPSGRTSVCGFKF